MNDHKPHSDAPDAEDQPSPLQGYFDWQVNTLMLAYDLAEPLPGDDEEAHHRRRAKVEDEVRTFSLAVIPEQYKRDASLAWPPSVMMALTRATFGRVSEILPAD